MKAAKLPALLLAALLLAAGALTGAGEAIPPEAYVPRDTHVRLDLDGDGEQETVYWETVREDEYSEKCMLTVTLGDGTVLTYAPDFEYALGVYAADMDADGGAELLISGDEASDDYVTVCLRLFRGRLEPLMFADCSRGTENRGYDRWGYGMVTAIEGSSVTLTGSQDVLGTWFASRTFALSDAGVFEFADSGKWVRDPVSLDGEAWEYAGLTAKRDLPCTAEDGSYAVLPAGTRLMILASDKETADFVTESGLRGTLDIERDWDRGWGYRVDGVPEEDAFIYIPYAD